MPTLNYNFAAPQRVNCGYFIDILEKIVRNKQYYRRTPDITFSCKTMQNDFVANRYPNNYNMMMYDVRVLYIYINIFHTTYEALKAFFKIPKNYYDAASCKSQHNKFFSNRPHTSIKNAFSL